MTDKERILFKIITRIVPSIYFAGSIDEKTKYINYVSNSKLKHGDLVYANSSFEMNDYIVGFVNSVHPNKVVIREIGSDKLCDYYNESFAVINKEWIGYEILEGIQYKIYEKVLKAFSKYTGYRTRFKSIGFENNKCIVELRECFKDSTIGRIEFEYNSKTSIKYIGSLLEAVDSYKGK